MHESERISKFLPLMQSLYGAAQEKLGFKPHAKIVIIKSNKNMAEPLGKTAHYSPSEHKIGLYTQGRHIKDILRSLAHELVHHNQNCRGDFDIAGETVQGYAQEDGHLREMEREAYECGNMIFRDWEDNLKEKGARPLFTSTHYTPPATTDIVGGGMIEGNKMKKKINESHLRDIIRGVIQEMFNDDLREGEDLGIDEKDEAETEIAQAGAEAASKGEEPYAVGGEELEENKKELDEEKKELDEEKEELDEEKEEFEEEELKETFFPKGRSTREKARVELNENLMKRWGYTKKEK